MSAVPLRAPSAFMLALRLWARPLVVTLSTYIWIVAVYLAIVVADWTLTPQPATHPTSLADVHELLRQAILIVGPGLLLPVVWIRACLALAVYGSRRGRTYLRYIASSTIAAAWEIMPAMTRRGCTVAAGICLATPIVIVGILTAVLSSPVTVALLLYGAVPVTVLAVLVANTLRRGAPSWRDLTATWERHRDLHARIAEYQQPFRTRVVTPVGHSHVA